MEERYNGGDPTISTHCVPGIKAEIVNPNIKKLNPKTATLAEIQEHKLKELEQKEKKNEQLAQELQYMFETSRKQHEQKALPSFLKHANTTSARSRMSIC